MPIMSYVVYSVEGKGGELRDALHTIPECEVHLCTSPDLLVLVTDTMSREQEEYLQHRLKAINSLGFLALVSGFNDPDIEPDGIPQ